MGFLIFAVLGAGPAVASTVTVHNANGEVRYLAAAGEANRLTVSVLSSSSDSAVFRFEDPGISIGVGVAPDDEPRCTYPDPADRSRVDCQVVRGSSEEPRVSIDAGDLDDQVTVEGPIPSSINGRAGNDVLRGGSAKPDILDFSTSGDTLRGGSGDDRLEGRDGNDELLDGDEGNDTVDGGAGGDEIVQGGAGDDTVLGGPEGDRVAGDAGADIVVGGPGNDELRGDQSGGFGGPGGSDRLSGGDGNDALDGGRGNDLMDGGPGDDRLSEVNSGASQPGCGSETYIGGAGRDNVTDGCGGPNNFLMRDGQQDTLSCGPGVVERLELDAIDRTVGKSCAGLTFKKVALETLIARGLQVGLACPRACEARVIEFFPYRIDGRSIGQSRELTSPGRTLRLNRGGTTRAFLPLTRSTRGRLRGAKVAHFLVRARLPGRTTVSRARLKFVRGCEFRAGCP